MLDFETITVAFANLSHQRVRSNLTILGIIIGVAAIVALLSLSEGLNHSVRSYLESLGSNTMMAEPAGDVVSMAFSRIKEADIKKIESVNGIEVVIPFYESSGTIKHGNEEAGGFFIGLDPKKINYLAESGYLSLSDGRFLESSDSYSIMVYDNFTTDAFKEKVGLKQGLEIKGKKFHIVGVLKQSNVAMSGFGAFNIVWAPETTVKELFSEANPTEAMVVVKDGFSQKELAEKIEAKLLRQRKEKTVNIMTSESMMEQVSAILGVIQVVLAGIAMIALIVGALGIMNTMVMAVIERTTEIGLLKAIGATDAKILEIFLAESGMIGLAGGTTGVILGYGISMLISFFAAKANFPLPIEINWGIVFGAMAFSLTVGILSGIIPAKMAARLDPVEALRYE